MKIYRITNLYQTQTVGSFMNHFTLFSFSFHLILARIETLDTYVYVNSVVPAMIEMWIKMKVTQFVQCMR